MFCTMDMGMDDGDAIYDMAVQNALYALTTLPLEGGEPVVEGEALPVAEDQTVVTE